jgi:hypothetical protein
MKIYSSGPCPFLAAPSANVQASKNDVLIAGQFRFVNNGNTSSIDPGKVKGYSLSALTREGIFLRDNIAFGIISGIGRSKREMGDQSQQPGNYNF